MLEHRYQVGRAKVKTPGSERGWESRSGFARSVDMMEKNGTPDCEEYKSA